MDDRSTLERAFEHARTAHEASRGLVRLTERDREVEAGIRRTTAMLGQLLEEAAATTPWTRWKAASGELVNSWATILMRALYIAPKRIVPEIVHGSSHHDETGVIRLPDNSKACSALAELGTALGYTVILPDPRKPMGRTATERSARKRSA